MDFTCPYCNRPTTVTSPNYDTYLKKIDIEPDRMDYNGDKVSLRYLAISCPNPSCRQLTLSLTLNHYIWADGSWDAGDQVQKWRLLPESTAKPQPEYIPEVIVSDYKEACRILDLSPKASAALARRCLQGIIRDYWGITKATLALEISALEEEVTTEIWSAIDSVRSVGNIGAHFEKDVNLIIDIEPDEAELLVRLLEDLFTEWYVTRHDRQERQDRLTQLAAVKQAMRKKKPEAEPVDDTTEQPEGSEGTVPQAS